MAVHKPVHTEGIYFITFTCFQWKPLFDLAAGYNLLYNWFDILKKCGNPVLGYAAMPNHVHLLLHYANTQQWLNTIIGNGKRFMGYELIKRLEQQEQTALLMEMQGAVQPKDRQRGKKHALWQGSLDVKECRTEAFVMQKLNYMHNNPLAERWRLCASVIDYPHSPARQYITGRAHSYTVRDYRDALGRLAEKEPS